MYHFTQTQDDDTAISYITAEFTVGNVVYLAIFSEDKDTLDFFFQYAGQSEILENKTVHSVKFAVKAYIEEGNTDLYAAPKNHQFGKNEISTLKKHLERLMFEHHALFKPDCYVFIAERPSLKRLYRKMCCAPSEFMTNFIPIIPFDDTQECFIIKTPTYKK